jgi:hypothetical protein
MTSDDKQYAAVGIAIALLIALRILAEFMPDTAATPFGCNSMQTMAGETDCN